MVEKNNGLIIVGIIAVIAIIYFIPGFNLFSIYDTSYTFNKDVNWNGLSLSATSTTDFNTSSETTNNYASCDFCPTSTQSYKNLITGGTTLTIDTSNSHGWLSFGNPSINTIIKSAPVIDTNLQSLSFDFYAIGSCGNGQGRDGGDVKVYLSSPSKDNLIYASPSLQDYFNGGLHSYSQNGKITIFENLGSYVIDVSGTRTTIDIKNESYKLIFVVRSPQMEAGVGSYSGNSAANKLTLSNLAIVNKPIIICTENAEKCEEDISYKCLNNAWVNQGQIDGKCGYTIPVVTPNITENITIPNCTSYTYSSWSSCSVSGTQTRTKVSSSPLGCVGGVSPILSQTCTYIPSGGIVSNITDTSDTSITKSSLQTFWDKYTFFIILGIVAVALLFGGRKR